MSPTTLDLSRARAARAVADLMARYTRLVDGLDFDELRVVLCPGASVRYRWRPVGAAEHDAVALAGIDEITAWLESRLAGRSELRRFVSDLELHTWSDSDVRAAVQMHERDMRISGEYQVHAVRTAAGWRVRQLDLTETIHF